MLERYAASVKSEDIIVVGDISTMAIITHSLFMDSLPKYASETTVMFFKEVDCDGESVREYLDGISEMEGFHDVAQGASQSTHMIAYEPYPFLLSIPGESMDDRMNTLSGVAHNNDLHMVLGDDLGLIVVTNVIDDETMVSYALSPDKGFDVVVIDGGVPKSITESLQSHTPSVVSMMWPLVSHGGINDVKFMDMMKDFHDDEDVGSDSISHWTHQFIDGNVIDVEHMVESFL